MITAIRSKIKSSRRIGEWPSPTFHFRLSDFPIDNSRNVVYHWTGPMRSEMSKRPTIRDVAQHAGLSKTTAGYVLSGRMDVAIPQATRARIFEAAKALKYRRNGVARSFATGKGQNLGVVVSYQGYVDGYQDAFVSRVLFGLQETCAKSHHGVLLAAANDETDTAKEQVNSLLEQKVVGMVIIGRIPGAQDLLDEAAQEHVRCVIVDDRSAADLADCIVTDDESGASLATSRLIQRGRARIGHLTAGTSTTTARDRRAGYQAALLEAGLSVEEGLTEAGSFVPRQALAAAARLLGQPRPPDAVFADSDYLALAVFQAVSERGLRVPDDVAIVGYGDLQVAEWLNLTTIRQNPEEMGRKAAAMVLSRLDRPPGKPREIILPVELIARGSCGSYLTTEILYKLY